MRAGVAQLVERLICNHHLCIPLEAGSVSQSNGVEWRDSESLAWLTPLLYDPPEARTTAVPARWSLRSRVRGGGKPTDHVRSRSNRARSGQIDTRCRLIETSCRHGVVGRVVWHDRSGRPRAAGVAGNGMVELLQLAQWLEYDRAERVDRLIACLGSVLTHT